MEQPSTMDKKLQSRPPPLQNKNQDNVKSGYDVAKRAGSQYPRKREYEKFDGSKKLSSNRGGRAGQRYVRPREKMGGQVEPKGSESEFGSLQRSGGKKQSITHLLNWWGPGPERHSRHGWAGANGSSCGYQKRKQSFHRPKYNKEHYLQANCQFVVSAGPDYSVYETDPDHLVNWEFIEEVRLHASESPSCPICLYPPVAAKVTLCGHIFCFPCILHYLSLTDEKWCKCPICFDAVSKEDLKSVATILHKDFATNEEIVLILMQRASDSLIPIPINCSPLDKGMTTLSSPAALLTHSKLIVASQAEVSRFVVAREMEALMCLLTLEGEEPEACFIQEALNLVSQRDDLLKANFPESTNSLKAENSVTPEDEIPLANLSLNDGHEGVVGYEITTTHSPDASPRSQISDGHQSNILAEDLVPGAKSPIGQNTGSKGVPNAVQYFYQESSGAHVYLHGLNLHMLAKEYGSLENCPHVINAKVLEKESFSMTEDRRHRLRYLRHLPITCPFDMVEILLKPPLISELTIAEFEGQLEQRERKRKKRARDEHRIERRVKVNEDRLMGRSRGASINMTSFKHFPSFAEEAALPLPSLYEEVDSSTPSFSSSLTDDLSDLSSTPSFAQMIRCGQKKPVNSVSGDFPSLGAASGRHLIQSVKGQDPVPWRHKDTDDDDEDDEEGIRVPDFSTAFSDAFAKAFDQATKKMTESSTDNRPDGSRPQGKKGKKKRIVLLSSGGR